MRSFRPQEAAGDIDILNGLSLSLRRVTVTNALEPSPALRQNCDGIFKASTVQVTLLCEFQKLRPGTGRGLARPTVDGAVTAVP